MCENWDQADEGIWETRGGRQHFTYSRLMSWVAVERAVRIARQRGLPADLVRWTTTRDAIYKQVIDRGWHPARGAFVQHYDTDVLDASVLLMPLTKFMAPTDPLWLSTLDLISKELVSDSLVYRYNPIASPDGLEGDEGTFTICSFWYVEALARAGRVDEARLVFEKMLTYANHVGLYSEEIGAHRRAARKLPAGVHPSGSDQRRSQPRPGARLVKRIGVISDPHGNLFALEAVLAELEREDLDGLVCLGDIAVGPQPAETLARVLALGCPIIKGNWDEWFSDGIPPADYEIGRWLVEIGEFWVAQLSAEDLAAMRGFAPTVDLDLGDGVKALCFHGSPSSNMEGIYAVTPDETVEQILGDARDAGPALRPHAPPDAAPPRALADREPGLDRAAVPRLAAAHDQRSRPGPSTGSSLTTRAGCASI